MSELTIAVRSWKLRTDRESLPPSGYNYSDRTKADYMFGDQKYQYNMKQRYGNRVPSMFNMYDPNTGASYKYNSKSYSKIK